jgi:CheY-like chemotaxis protein
LRQLKWSPCLDVLIVDDNAIALDNLTLIARSMGWNAAKAESGEIALQKIRAKKECNGFYDAILIDWKMPVLDGLETAQKIRNEFKGDPIPIVLMVAAFSREELLHHPNADIVEGVLCKPITSSSLYNSVAEALNSIGRHVIGGRSQSDGCNVKRLHDVRILIVDDSEINREVAMRIVSTDGAIVSLANNGKEALEFLVNHPDAVDIVLMDVQMPVMDGYEATLRLRNLFPFADLPIVALTAGAFKAQQDAALKAGMSAFVSKPFNVEELVSTIQRFTHCQPLVVEDDGKQSDAVTVAPAVTHLPGMDIEQALSIWGDAELYRQYLTVFSNENANVCDELNGYFSKGGYKQARELLHKLKGIAGNLGLAEVAHVAAQLEQIKPPADPRHEVGQLHSALARVFSSIASYLANGTNHLPNSDQHKT